MEQSSRQVGIGNLTHTENIDHAEVLAALVVLEPLDGLSAVIDRNEVDELSVVLDLLGGLLNLSLQVQHVFLLAGLRLEE